jgi:hypothetical protein
MTARIPLVVGSDGLPQQLQSSDTIAGAVTQGSLQAQTYEAFTTGGTGTAYTLTPTPAIAAYVINQAFFVTFNAASGASPTLQISGLATPPTLVKQLANGTYTNIVSGDFPSGHVSRVVLISATQALVEKLPPLVGATGNSLARPTTTLTSASGVLTINLALGYEVYLVTLTENITSILFQNLPSSSAVTAEISIEFTQPASGSPFTVSNPATTGGNMGGVWAMAQALGVTDVIGLRLTSAAKVKVFWAGAGQ